MSVDYKCTSSSTKTDIASRFPLLDENVKPKFHMENTVVGKKNL